MAMVKVAAEDLRQIREALVKTAALEKRAEIAERRSAMLEHVLGLVDRGLMDSSVALSKLGEFTADPDQLRIFEAASDYHGASVKLGVGVDDTGVTSASTPENKLALALQNIAGDSSQG